MSFGVFFHHYLPNTDHNLGMIKGPTVQSNDGSEKASSLMGRAICLAHTLATPLKAWSGLGRLALTVLETARIILNVLTLNKHPKKLLKATFNVIDVFLGAFLLPIALLANVIRGVVGTIFHPGAMICRTEFGGIYAIDHNVFKGTVVHYPMESFNHTLFCAR